MKSIFKKVTSILLMLVVVILLMNSITVNAKTNFDSKKAIKSLKTQLYDTGDGIIAIIKNGYNKNISLNATITYYNDGKKVGITPNDNYCFVSGTQCALYFVSPMDSNFDALEYDDYKISYKAEVSTRKSNLKYIKEESELVSDKVIVDVKNTGKQTAEFTTIAIVFYNNGQVIGYDSNYVDVQNKGDSDSIEFYAPYDSNFDTLVFDDYKIFINGSYN